MELTDRERLSPGDRQGWALQPPMARDGIGRSRDKDGTRMIPGETGTAMSTACKPATAPCPWSPRSGRDVLVRLVSKLAVLVALSTPLLALAFDPSRLHDGLYYNGSNIDDPLWTPLLLVRNGEMKDPFLEVARVGVTGMSGPGITERLQATTPSLMAGCWLATELGVSTRLLAPVDTAFVVRTQGESCLRRHAIAFANFSPDARHKSSDQFPRFLLRAEGPGKGADTWLIGVPGLLIGTPSAYLPMPREVLARTPEVNGVVSRISFATQPLIEPDGAELDIGNSGKPRNGYQVNLEEASHRTSDTAIKPNDLTQVRAAVNAAGIEPYRSKLRAALRGKFGGIAREFVEFGLIQAIDIDNTRSFDYVGQVRIGAITRAGPWRWIDVVWTWRKALGGASGALQVLQTSEPELFDPARRYFSETRPSPWAPTLAVSSIADLDKDKLLEIITTIQSPVAMAYAKPTSQASAGIPIDFRQSVIHAWTPDDTDRRRGTWKEVWKTSVHEARRIQINAAEVSIEKFGE